MSPLPTGVLLWIISLLNLTVTSSAEPSTQTVDVGLPDSLTVQTIQSVRRDTNRDFKPDQLGDTVSVGGRIIVSTGVLHTEYLETYLDDGTGGIALYSPRISASYNRGDSVIARGLLSHYNGELQIIDPQLTRVDAPPRIVQPIPLNGSYEHLEPYEGRLVTLTGHVTNTHLDEEGQHLILSMGGERSINITVYVSGFHSHAADFDLGRYSVGDKITATGLLGQFDYAEPYDRFYQLYPRTPADLQAVGVTTRFYNRLLIAAGVIFLLALLWVYSLRKQVRHRTRELSEKEHQYRTIFERAADAIFLFQTDLTILECNEAAENLFDRSRDQISGASVLDLVEPADNHTENSDLANRLSSPSRQETEAIAHVNDEKIHLLIKTSTILHHGQTQNLALIRNITGEKKARRELINSREQYYQLFKNSPSGIFRYNNDLIIEECNDSFLRLIRAERSQIEQLDMSRIVDQRPIPALRKALAGEIGYYEGPYQTTTSDHTVQVSMSTAPNYDRNGEVKGGIGIVEDVTARKKAENERSRLNEELRKSLREKEVLLSEIHHRVKNNLAVITGLLMLQSEMIEDPQAQELFKESESRIQSMAMIHEMLYQNHSYAEIEFQNYIERLIDSIKLNYESHEADITTTIETVDVKLDLETAIPCALIINELLTNAYKYAFEGRDEGKINVSLQQKDENYILIVDDDGIGLPEDFEQKAATSLGMTLIRELTSQINGEIEYLQRENGGTRVQIIFPKEG